MNESRVIVSKNLVENVLPTLGTNSKKPNSIVMAIGEDFILEALSLFKDKKSGIERETGLVRLELVAVYAEEETLAHSLPAHGGEDYLKANNLTPTRDISEDKPITINLDNETVENIGKTLSSGEISVTQNQENNDHPLGPIDSGNPLEEVTTQGDD